MARQNITGSKSWKPSQRSSTGMTGQDFKKVVDELTGIRKKLFDQGTSALTTRPVEIIREEAKKSQKINHNITPYLINGKKVSNNSENQRNQTY